VASIPQKCYIIKVKRRGRKGRRERGEGRKEGTAELFLIKGD
jgi:hypothetical protein